MRSHRAAGERKRATRARPYDTGPGKRDAKAGHQGSMAGLAGRYPAPDNGARGDYSRPAFWGLTERDEAGLGCPVRVIRQLHPGESLYGIFDVSGEYSAHDLRMLHDYVSRMVPNWRLVYDGDLLEAARDLGLLDEDDPAEGDYDELDLSEEASWRRYAGEEGEDDAEDS